MSLAGLVLVGYVVAAAMGPDEAAVVEVQGRTEAGCDEVPAEVGEMNAVPRSGRWRATGLPRPAGEVPIRATPGTGASEPCPATEAHRVFCRAGPEGARPGNVCGCQSDEEAAIRRRFPRWPPSPGRVAVVVSSGHHEAWRSDRCSPQPLSDCG